MITLTKDKYLSPTEQTELARILKLIEANNTRDALMVELALKSGAREGELVQIEASDLDPIHKSVFIKDPEKSSDKREIPLDSEFYSRLNSHFHSHQGRLFPITTSRVRQIWGDIRPWPKKFHSLRHTFAKNVRSQLKGKREDITLKDLETLQYLLGHKSIENTMIYARENLEVTEIRKAMGL